MGVIHSRLGEEGLVGGEQRQVEAHGEIDEGRFGAGLVGHAVAHDLHIEAAGIEGGEFS